MQNIEVRLCLPEEIEQVISINTQWQRNELAGNLTNGFVTGKLDPNYLKEVIDKKEIVVVLDGSFVVGYNLIKDSEHSPTSYAK